MSSFLITKTGPPGSSHPVPSGSYKRMLYLPGFLPEIVTISTNALYSINRSPEMHLHVAIHHNALSGGVPETGPVIAGVGSAAAGVGAGAAAAAGGVVVVVVVGGVWANAADASPRQKPSTTKFLARDFMALLLGKGVEDMLALGAPAPTTMFLFGRTFFISLYIPFFPQSKLRGGSESRLRDFPLSVNRVA